MSEGWSVFWAFLGAMENSTARVGWVGYGKSRLLNSASHGLVFSFLTWICVCHVVHNIPTLDRSGPEKGIVAVNVYSSRSLLQCAAQE